MVVAHVLAGGPVANTAAQSVLHCWAQGQCAGRCSTGLRCRRAGTVTRWRRRVAPRATACRALASVPAARSRLWVIAAQMAQAPAGGSVGQRAVDQVGEHGFDDRVPAVGDVRVRGRLGAVGEERVMAPLCAGPRYGLACRWIAAWAARLGVCGRHNQRLSRKANNWSEGR